MSLVPTESVRDATNPGARPAGTATEAAAAQNIRQMFDTIAPTYDRANHLLSAGLDRTWWLRAARALRPILARPEAVVLDLCCGTGDMTLALYAYRPKPDDPSELQRLKPGTESGPDGTAKAVPLSKAECKVSKAECGANGSGPGARELQLPAPILAADFSHNMLALALPKFAGKHIVPLEADALHLPLPDSSVDLVTFAFGFRNLANYAEGLTELYRVLRPGGEIAILECNQPDGLIGTLYSFYFHRILPVLGGLISGTPRAYAYLPDSVERFPRPPRMKQMIAAAGFANPRWTSYTFGTAGLYRAIKP
jgi:demethylmenaquinone methyltransferase/2-methoxy-6-polyprenyl-1,4-benzoquinol methylase